MCVCGVRCVCYWLAPVHSWLTDGERGVCVCRVFVSQVGKALKSIEEVEAELAKQKAATKELKDATKAVQANRQKVRFFLGDSDGGGGLFAHESRLSPSPLLSLSLSLSHDPILPHPPTNQPPPYPQTGESAVEAENLRRQAQRFEERLAHLRRSAKAKVRGYVGSWVFGRWKV